MSGRVIAALDLEWTAWEGSAARRWSGPGEEMEIVQIGAVRLVDDAEMAETGALDVLVRPRLNPVLSDYFIDLTGITQERLDVDGVPFAEALDRLVRFLGTDTRAVLTYGTDAAVIRRNCTLDGLDFPFDDALFVNARALLAERIGERMNTVYSSDLPEVLGFAPPGTSHQAVDDARCVAEALRILRRRRQF